MSAETLRRAAALMRERAEAATEGPWLAVTGSGPKRRRQQTALVGAANMRGQGEKGCIAVFAGINGHKADDADHAASWHPAVALAVAEWLEATVPFFEMYHDDGDHPALALARAYLGEPA